MAFAINYDTATPVQMLQNIKLTTAVTLENGPDVYAKLNALSRQHTQLQDPAPDLNTVASIAWLANPSVDSKKMSIMLPAGTSLFQAAQAIALKRGEEAIDQRNYILIVPAKHQALLKTYLETGGDETGPLLDRWFGAIIPPGVTDLEAIDLPTLTDFINGKFKESLAYDPSETAGPFTIKITPLGGAKAAKFSAIGEWSYRTLVEACCQLLDLRWKIVGSNVVVEPPNAKSTPAK